VETFTEPKELAENPHYQDQRQRTLAALSDDMIDAPIVDLIKAFNELPYCFTLQSCYGHFVYKGQEDPHNLEPLPVTDTIARVEYRIAYICVCVEKSDWGRRLLRALNDVTAMDRENIQFCSAEWFWKRQINSYALQVEPERFKHRDTSVLGYREALHIERTRNKFFARLGAVHQEAHP
jgi:hypothetical protein